MKHDSVIYCPADGKENIKYAVQPRAEEGGRFENLNVEGDYFDSVSGVQTFKYLSPVQTS